VSPAVERECLICHAEIIDRPYQAATARACGAACAVALYRAENPNDVDEPEQGDDAPNEAASPAPVDGR
jgi:hypothetical protein